MFWAHMSVLLLGGGSLQPPVRRPWLHVSPKFCQIFALNRVSRPLEHPLMIARLAANASHEECSG